MQRVTVPVDTRVKVYIPTKEDRISIAGKNILKPPGIAVKEKEEAYTLVEMGSGSYEFVMNK